MGAWHGAGQDQREPWRAQGEGLVRGWERVCKGSLKGQGRAASLN